MGTFNASRELPVWIGGLIGLFILMTVLLWFKRNSSMDIAKTPPEALVTNPANLVFFQSFAATFIACALLQDLSTVFFPSFYIPLSAKYVMAFCASLPAYILKRRG